MRTPTCFFTFYFMFMLPAFAQTRAAVVVAGQVSAERQIPAHAWVRLLRFGTVVDERPTVRAGQFEFSGLAPGRYTIQVDAPGFVPVTIEADAVGGNETAYLFIDLKRPRQSETGRPKTVSVAEHLIPKGARREFERARAQQKRSNCANALVHLEKAVTAYSRYASAHNEMGNCYVQLGMPDRAEESFKRAIKLATTVYPSMNLADVYVQQGRFEEARSVLYAAIRSNPGEGDAYYAVALAYFEEGRIDEAESAALEADSRIHRIADLHLLLANIYLQKKTIPAIVRQLETYLEEAPSGPRKQQVRNELEQLRREWVR